MSVSSRDIDNSVCWGNPRLCSTSFTLRGGRAGDERSRRHPLGFLFIYRTMWNVLISIGDGAGEDTVRISPAACLGACTRPHPSLVTSTTSSPVLCYFYISGGFVFLSVSAGANTKATLLIQRTRGRWAGSHIQPYVKSIQGETNESGYKKVSLLHVV